MVDPANPVMVLLYVPVPVPSCVLFVLSVDVVFHTTPLSVMGDPPSEVTVDPVTVIDEEVALKLPRVPEGQSA